MNGAIANVVWARSLIYMVGLLFICCWSRIQNLFYEMIFQFMRKHCGGSIELSELWQMHTVRLTDAVGHEDIERSATQANSKIIIIDQRQMSLSLILILHIQWIRTIYIRVQHGCRPFTIKCNIVSEQSSNSWLLRAVADAIDNKCIVIQILINRWRVFSRGFFVLFTIAWVYTAIFATCTTINWRMQLLSNAILFFSSARFGNCVFFSLSFPALRICHMRYVLALHASFASIDTHERTCMLK